ncbi:unnamed protein product [Parascedosporium putredinis]|uniref:DUF7871 domain-containing protein n=1 Tax=Parascedosporium putredinis TaxID=1442378 RepID=A0A9P1M9L2_9PEZI|nr:unnamed protein product [Parascedosporium putredinis]CAI7992278.1 unnamed protein product [Parascedosporium putredinis]
MVVRGVLGIPKVLSTLRFSHPGLEEDSERVSMTSPFARSVLVKASINFVAVSGLTLLFPQHILLVNVITPPKQQLYHGEGSCVCAEQATCSCGKQSALHCTCDKAPAENSITGPSCSCGARPVGKCTCANAASENQKPAGSTCSCGARPAGSCTCHNTANEIDFTTKK